MNHLNIENPCNMCKFYRPEYIMAHDPTYDKCTKIKSPYSGRTTYCDLERDPTFDNITECGSIGRCFKPSSKKERILKHIKGFFFGVNSILIIILIMGFTPLLILLF